MIDSERVEDLPLGLAIDLVFGGGNSVSSKHHPSKMTSLEDMVMGGPLLRQPLASTPKSDSPSEAR